MIRCLAVLAVLAVLATTAAVSSALPVGAQNRAPGLLTVYCAGAAPDGFLRPEVTDSARDLRNALAGKKKTLRLVDDPRRADVEVVIDGRERWGPLRTVYVTLRAGDHEERFVGTDDMFWELAADNAAKWVDRWLKINRMRLLAARTSQAMSEGDEEKASRLIRVGRACSQLLDHVVTEASDLDQIR